MLPNSLGPFEDWDITPLYSCEPLQDVWLQASREYYTCVEGVPPHTHDINLVCGLWTSYINRVAYCTRCPGHKGQHVSGPDDRETAIVWGLAESWRR